LEVEEKVEIPRRRGIGVIQFFNQNKGYGVINGEGILKLFLHHSQIVGTGNLKTLVPGVHVTYDSYVNCFDKHVAYRVEILDENNVPKTDETKGLKKLYEKDKNKIHLGIVNWFGIREGYGFITPDVKDTADIFHHQSEIYAEQNVRFLHPGDKVEFKLALVPNGRIVAVSVTGQNGESIKIPRGDFYDIKKDELDTEMIKNQVLEELKKADINSFPFINPPPPEYYEYPQDPRERLRYSLIDRPPQRGKGPKMDVPDDNPIIKGKVTQYSPRKYFGFVKTEAGEEIFVHQSEIHAEGYRLLQEGEDVEFRIAVNEKGKKYCSKVTGLNGAFVKYVEPNDEKELRAQALKRRKEQRKRKGKKEKKEPKETKPTTTSEGPVATVEQYYCSVCNISLSGAAQLDVHNKGKKHIKLTSAAVTNNGAIYRCLECNKSFPNRLDLQKHMNGKHMGANIQEIVSSSLPSSSQPILEPKPQTTTIEFVPQGTTTTVGPTTRPTLRAPSGKSKKRRKRKLVQSPLFLL